MQYPTYKIFLCDVINPVNDKNAQLIRDGVIVLKRYGNTKKNFYYKIDTLGKEKEILPNYYGKKSIELIQMANLLAMPTFFDMHFHWVQDEVCSKPKTSLLTWLQKYTWPYEAKFKDKNFSRKKAQDFSGFLIKVGTLGGACYSSIHSHALQDAFKYFIGDFIIGNVIMTTNSPSYLCMNKKNSHDLVKKMIKKFDKKYALTPRFALSVDGDLMKNLGQYVKNKKVFIQTHLSETKKEIESVLSMYRNFKGFEKVQNYTQIYDKCSLIGKRSLFGHGIHLSTDELKLLKQKGAWIAHCPTSNAPIKDKGLGSGLFDFLKVEREKVNWVLASDIGGGPFLSMFDVIESFVGQNQKIHKRQATYTRGLNRSTLKPCEFLGLSTTHGSLDRGKFANMIFVKSPKKNHHETAEQVLKKLISPYKNKRKKYLDMVEYTYYKGQEIYSRSSKKLGQ